MWPAPPHERRPEHFFYLAPPSPNPASDQGGKGVVSARIVLRLLTLSASLVSHLLIHRVPASNIGPHSFDSSRLQNAREKLTTPGGLSATGRYRVPQRSLLSQLGPDKIFGPIPKPPSNC